MAFVWATHGSEQGGTGMQQSCWQAGSMQLTQGGRAPRAPSIWRICKSSTYAEYRLLHAAAPHIKSPRPIAGASTVPQGRPLAHSLPFDFHPPFTASRLSPSTCSPACCPTRPFTSVLSVWRRAMGSSSWRTNLRPRGLGTGALYALMRLRRWELCI